MPSHHAAAHHLHRTSIRHASYREYTAITAIPSEPLTISIITQNTIEENTQSSGTLIEEKESARALATDMTIACLYLASSIPQTGPAASTATDIAASALWLGDGLNELRDKNKKICLSNKYYYCWPFSFWRHPNNP